MVFERLTPDRFDELRELFGNDKKGLWLEYRKQRLAQFANGEAETYVIESSGRLVGEVTAKFTSDKLAQETAPNVRVYFEAFRVLPEYQGQGLGTKLMEFVISELRTRGYTEFTIGVEDSNVVARHIYEKLGFTQKIAHGYGDKFDPSEYDLYLFK